MTPVIELHEIRRHYVGPPEMVALRDCSLIVHEGDFVTVSGPSGSGKSTLLNIIGLLDQPSSGTYRLRGEDVASLRERRRAFIRGRDIGFVFQSFQLLEQRSCLDNVMLADLYTGTNSRQSQEAATAALVAVGLEHRIHHLAVQLSGGERQRVAIARAMVGNPAVLLCDEPTGNLDSRNAEGILDLFVCLNQQGVTIVLVTHDPVIAALGNRRVTSIDGIVTSSDAGTGIS